MPCKCIHIRMRKTKLYLHARTSNPKTSVYNNIIIYYYTAPFSCARARAYPNINFERAHFRSSKLSQTPWTLLRVPVSVTSLPPRSPTKPSSLKKDQDAAYLRPLGMPKEESGKEDMPSHWIQGRYRCKIIDLRILTL